VSKSDPKETKKKKVVSKKRVTKKKVAAKPATKKTASKKKVKTTAKGSPLISPRERYEMIATMAYYRAEQRNFEPGHDVEDWLECEEFIDKMLSS
jgi:hypothetical protein